MIGEAGIVVAGGGPAGLAAAARAAELGAPVLLVEERSTLGGQLCYRAQPVMLQDGVPAERPDTLVRRLVDDVDGAGVELMTDTLLAGCYGGFEVVIAGPEGTRAITPGALIVATGSTDLPLPFAGATLPGVFSRRAVQLLLNQYRLLPGRRFAIVGSGPEAEELEIDILLAGGEVVWRGVAPAPLLRAEGRGGVERLVVGSESFGVDIIAIAVGRQADAALAAMAGAAMAFAPELGGWVPVLDAALRCMGTRLFVAGDAAGVGSVGAAIGEGRLAGEAAAAALRFGHGRSGEAPGPGSEELAWRMDVRTSLEPAYAQPYAST